MVDFSFFDVTQGDGVRADHRLEIHTNPARLILNSSSTTNPLQNQRIFIAGHRGMVGAAVQRNLEAKGAGKLIVRSRKELNLCNQAAVNDFFATEKPEVVVFAAAKVGGIYANKTYPAEFIYENLMMATNAIHAAYENDTKRFLFLGSTCIYPRSAPQPMPENCLLSGPLESTNEAYAIAKIGGLKLCEFYRSQYGVTFHSAMPTNLYGPGDNYHPENSHVLPALIRRFHQAKMTNADSVTIWGTGKPRREFLHVNDLANALVHLLKLDDPPNLVNVGTGKDISIQELAELVARTIGFAGQILHDKSRPDGTPLKLTDCSQIHATGWNAELGLDEGVRQTYDCFLHELEAQKLRSH